ncbi:MAG TPA: hypothetical protein VJ652_14980 [Noviherbaspirillum sp.]|nr:hypothetical protein [Noviherbaspirillum sp.]
MSTTTELKTCNCKKRDEITLEQIRNAVQLAVIPMGDVVEQPMRNAIINLDIAALAVHKLIYGSKV